MMLTMRPKKTYSFVIPLRSIIFLCLFGWQCHAFYIPLSNQKAFQVASASSINDIFRDNENTTAENWITSSVKQAKEIHGQEHSINKPSLISMPPVAFRPKNEKNHIESGVLNQSVKQHVVSENTPAFFANTPDQSTQTPVFLHGNVL